MSVQHVAKASSDELLHKLADPDTHHLATTTPPRRSLMLHRKRSSRRVASGLSARDSDAALSAGAVEMADVEMVVKRRNGAQLAHQRGCLTCCSGQDPAHQPPLRWERRGRGRGRGRGKGETRCVLPSARHALLCLSCSPCLPPGKPAVVPSSARDPPTP
jgi:hypothetical protein